MRLFVLLYLTYSSTYAISLNTYWDENDTVQLSKVLEDVLKTKKDKIASLHYAVSGLKLLNVAPSATSAQEVCEVAKKADLKVLETLYHASALSGDLPGCALSKINEAQVSEIW
uniref:Dolichyl-diphosphooligosaccharide--protein glycosyltransferase subunit 2 n=1 Tax=Angiostrongylus cantonensis TaxID=6313 RepID=A0A0K0D0I7_ANGCA